MTCNKINGYTADSPKHFFLDSGAFYKDYDVNVDTPLTAESKLLGLTRGGGEFAAVPTIRMIEVDGIRTNTKGFDRIDDWLVTLTGTMLEMTSENFQAILGAASVDTSTNLSYDIITGNQEIVDGDYSSNITYIGTKSGSSNPIILQVLNSLNKTGLTITTVDKNEGTMEAVFTGHYEPTEQCTVPFRIYNPKITGDVTAPTVTVVPVDLATGIALDTTIVWTFSEPVSSASVNSANFMLLEVGVPVAGALTQSLDKITVTFTPTVVLITATAYTAIATTNVKDLNGNALEATNVSNFVTV